MRYLFYGMFLMMMLGLAACTPQETASISAEPVQDTAAVEPIMPDKPVLTLGENGQGTLATPVSVGEDYGVLVTLSFQYSDKEGKKQITGIGEATVENAKGWFHVNRVAEIDREHIYLSDDGWQATVPFTYYVSLGSGYDAYDSAAVISLNADMPMSQP